MTREEAITALGDRNILLWGMSWEEQKYYSKALDRATSALKESKGEWIPVEKCGYPKPEDEYKHFLTIDNKGEITIQEFLLSLDEEPQPYFTGMRNIVAWQPLPEVYKPEKPETCKGCLEPCIMYEANMRACKKKVTERGE